MGMDVVFDLNKAKEAGLEVTREANGTADAIEAAKAELALGYDAGYVEWLEAEEDIGKMPNYPNSFHLNPCEQDDGTLMAFVRANKWGNLYKPLTTFLKDNNIEYDECE